MDSYNFSEFESKQEKASSFVLHSPDDATHPTELYIDLFQQVDIKRKSLHKLQLATSRIIPMDLQKIMNENEYQMCLQDARGVISLDKSLFCPNFYYVFYAEVEIHLNRFFTENSREQWSLLFVDYNFMPPIYINENNFNRYKSFQIFTFQPHILTIVHNAKIKYCCLHCKDEWTTARGRAIFQAEIPEINKYNILFAYLFTQKCQKCRQETVPSWYVDEATRVMKNVCRILLDQFYSHRQLESLSSSEDDIQRLSDMKDHHQQDLCQACQEGSCYASHWQHQQMR